MALKAKRSLSIPASVQHSSVTATSMASARRGFGSTAASRSTVAAPAASQQAQSSVSTAPGIAAPVPRRLTTLAQVIEAFPGLLRSSKPAQATHNPPSLTQPVSPVLSTAVRTRPCTVKSTAEKEAEEMALIRPFHAHPVDPRVLGSQGDLGVPRVEPAPVTTGKYPAFVLRSLAQREEETKAREEQRLLEEERRSAEAQFRARPIPEAVRLGIVSGLPEKEHIPLTEPHSPRLRTNERSAVWEELYPPASAQDGRPLFTAHPAPDFVRLPVFAPVLTHKHTVPEHVGAAAAAAEMEDRRRRDVQSVLDDEQASREFRAQPIPTDEPSRLPPKQQRPLTEPQPFHLLSEYRHEEAMHRFREQMQQEMEQSRKRAESFRAQEPSVLWEAPFVPQPSFAPVTIPDDVALNTESRAAARRRFDEEQRLKEAQAAELAAAEARRREALAQKEIRELRKRAEFHANPVPRYEPALIKASERPLTVPISPNLRTSRKRAAGESLDDTYELARRSDANDLVVEDLDASTSSIDALNTRQKRTRAAASRGLSKGLRF
jgi:hypothetical protein